MVRKKHHNEIYNRITQKLLQWFGTSSDKNIVFSPYSIIMLLGMLSDATASETRDEIVSAVGEKDFHEFISWLKIKQKELFSDKSIASANVVCIHEDLSDKVKRDYKKRLHDIFEGELFSSKNMESAVNEWVKKSTRRMIPRIADKSVQETLVALMNAIAFEAKWEKKYDSYDIDIGDFHNLNGTLTEN